MKPLLLFVFGFLCLKASSQNVKIEKNIVYRTATDWQNQRVDLKMDIFSPEMGKELPLVIFIHGGGFYNGNKETHTAFCSSLSSEGYVVANINYRLGFDTVSAQKDRSIMMAIYRACQDAFSALRFLVNHAKDYHIDTTAVFISGESAGAVTSLSDAYVSQKKWDAMFPALHEKLGDLTTEDGAADGSRIRGVVSLWGGMLDTALISVTGARRIPVALFQSRSDEVIPFQHSQGLQAAYSSLYGSYDIEQRFRNSDGCARLYFTKNAKHFFGFSHHYVIAKMRSFISDVLNGVCKSTAEENSAEKDHIPFSDYQ